MQRVRYCSCLEGQKAEDDANHRPQARAGRDGIHAEGLEASQQAEHRHTAVGQRLVFDQLCNVCSRCV